MLGIPTRVAPANDRDAGTCKCDRYTIALNAGCAFDIRTKTIDDLPFSPTTP